MHNGTNVPQDTNAPGILSNDLYDILFLSLACSMYPLVCLVGITTNSLNLITFVKMGLSDGVTVCFFALSVSDFCLVLLMLRSIIGYCAYRLIEDLAVNIPDLTYLSSKYYRMFYDTSVITTTFIAIQRGCCVAFPLHLKGVFTRNRNIVVIVFIYLFGLASYLPVYLNEGLAPYTDPETNLTTLVLNFKAGWTQVNEFSDILNKILVPFAGQTLVLLCLVVITIGMKSSSKFRQKSALSQPRLNDSPKEKSKNSTQRRSNYQPSPDERDNKQGCFLNNQQDEKKKRKVKGMPMQFSLTKQKLIRNRPKDAQMQSKQNQPTSAAGSKLPAQQGNTNELKVLRQVSLVSTVYVVCNTPQILVSLVKLLEQEFDHGRLYNNMYWLMFAVVNLFELVNASVNFFIYYKFNNKYRAAVHVLCRWQKRHSGQ